jgi:hypothetical protein
MKSRPQAPLLKNMDTGHEVRKVASEVDVVRRMEEQGHLGRVEAQYAE